MAQPSSGPSPATRSLTVLLAPATGADEVLGVLADYSAAGLLEDFVWVNAGQLAGPTTPATRVHSGRSDAVVLQQVLTAERYDRTRVAVLVQLDSPADERVSLSTQQAIEQVVRSSTVGGRVTLLRMLLTSGRGGPAESSDGTVLEGWHNLLVAPEDSADPGLGAVPWGPLPEPLDLAQRAAPVIAAIAGLWADCPQTPFDTVEILPGQTVRAVRAFYRNLDTSDVEVKLRARLFDPEGRLPLPRGGQVPVLYVEDVPAAAQSMARALWTKHRDVLRGPRVGSGDTEAQAISIWAALKMFLRFMGAALRNAPSAWLSAVRGSVTSALAATVQGTVFGAKGSAFSVVTAKEAADWREIGSSADSLSAALGGPGAGHQAQQDMSPLWMDFVNGALTLADGGRRTGGLEPIQVGSGIGVLANAADVVPSRADGFRAIPTSLAAVVGVTEIEPADLLGVGELRERLQACYSDPNAGVEARTAAGDLDRWQQQASRSFAWQTAAVLVDFLGRARNEVGELVERIRRATAETSIDERLKSRQQALGVVLATLTWATLFTLIVLLAVAAFGVTSWKFSLITGGALIVLYFLVALVLFMVLQRDLFALMNSRKTQQDQLDAMQANLKNALADVSRLSSAYGQLQSWCRALGPVLRAPFGPAPSGRGTTAPIASGLPRCAQVGVADPGQDQAGDAIHGLERRLYALGWLTQPWQNLVHAAATQLREEPEMLYRMPGVGSASGLDQWSAAVSAGQVQSSGAAALWSRVEQMFAEDATVGSTLTANVAIPGSGAHIPAARFGAGFLDHKPGRAAPFDSAVFANTAATAGRTAVAIDTATMTRIGLGYRAVVVQASDGLAPYDFALFEVPLTMMAGTDDEVTHFINRPGPPQAPPGEDMVF